MSVFFTREMLWEAANESKSEAPGGLLDRLVRAVARRRQRSKTINELSALSDLELRDIGIYRADIPRIANWTHDLHPRATRLAPGAKQSDGHAISSA